MVKKLLGLILAAMSASANAQQPDQWYVGMDAGLMQAYVSQRTMTVPNGSGYPVPGNVDQYYLSQFQPMMLDIQAGHRWYRDQQWLPSYVLALRYEHIFTKSVSGTVTQYSDPAFTNYSYNWSVLADAITLYSKLDLVQFSRFMLYIDLGLGVSYNQSNYYHEESLTSVMARDNPDYASRTIRQFTYNVGLGLDYRLNTNLLMSAGYSYQSFGNLSSGFGEGPDWSNAQLKVSNIDANIEYVGVSYLF